MPYNFYLDNKIEDDIIKPYNQSQYDGEQHTKDSTSSEADGSSEIKVDSEKETASKETIIDTKEMTENYNINPPSQNLNIMDETNGTQTGEFFDNQSPQGQQVTNNTQEDGTDDMNQNRQSENEQAENETPAVTLIDAEDLPPFKSEVWDMFQLQLKDKDSFFKQKDYPRKPLMIDADLYSTLREIDIDNIAPTNLLNAILRTFIESFKEDLRQYRKIQAPSVF